MEKQTKDDISIKLVGSYIPDSDQTVIFEYTYINGKNTKIELVGWYFGEPKVNCIKGYANRNYVCEF